jgi:uncharacterized Zn finger protein
MAKRITSAAAGTTAAEFQSSYIFCPRCGSDEVRETSTAHVLNAEHDIEVTTMRCANKECGGVFHTPTVRAVPALDESPPLPGTHWVMCPNCGSVETKTDCATVTWRSPDGGASRTWLKCSCSACQHDWKEMITLAPKARR